MKLNLAKKTAQPVALKRPTLGSPQRGTVGGVISRPVADAYSAYVSPHVSVNTCLVRPILGLPIPNRLTQTGYLLIIGENGMLVRSVHHDAKGDLYKRDDEGTYGSVTAFNTMKREDLKASLVTAQALVAYAKKHGAPIEVTHVKTEQRIMVWALNSFGDKYVAALTVTNGKLGVLNLEHTSAPKVEQRYDDPKNLKISHAAFFAKV